MNMNGRSRSFLSIEKKTFERPGLYIMVKINLKKTWCIFCE